MSNRISLNGTTVNAPDALALAQFYAEITAGTATGSAHWAVVNGPNGFISFQQVETFRRPTWPDPDVPAHLHLDFLVNDRRATARRVLTAGATRLGVQPNDDHCTVYADPAGHPFCLSTWDLR